MEPTDVQFYSRKRYVIVFLTFFGMACFNILRTNLSIALVRMTLSKRIVTGNETFIQVSRMHLCIFWRPRCYFGGIFTSHSFWSMLKDAEFSWTAQQKGVLLSLSFFGYLFAPVGGFIGSNIGYCTVFGFCVGANSIISFLSPTLLRCGIYIYGTSRILEGIFEVGIK